MVLGQMTVRAALCNEVKYRSHLPMTGPLGRGPRQYAPYALGVDLPSAKTRRLIVVAMLALAAAVFATAVVIYQSSPGGPSLPAAIQSVSPQVGTNVLSQTDVTVDLAVGYTAELEINGIVIPENELFRVEALNQLSYQPRDGKVVPKLLPDRNCVRVFYWLISQGDRDRQNYTWCFDAS